MNLEKLEVCEIRKISVDELLKEQPEQLPFLEPTENEPDNYTMNVNKVIIHDVRSHELVYGRSYVIIHFYNKYDTVIASISAFGSNEYKEDEHFYIDSGSIVSETSLRVLSSYNS